MTIFTLIIGHKHGNNVSLCRTEDRAKKELLEYVRENWTAESMLLTADDFEDPVGEYFESVTSECYEILQLELLP
jgi:hypothetical protein